MVLGTEKPPIKQALAGLRECIQEFSNPRRRKDKEFFVSSEFLKYADFRELLALKHGLKPSVGARVPFEPVAYQSAKEWAKENSFEIGHTTHKYIINSNRDICEPIPLDDPRKGDVYVIIANDFDLVKRGADSYASDVVEFGRVMGYPECCLEFGKSMSNNLGKREKLEEDFIWSRVKFRCYRNSDYFSHYLNVFHGFGVVPHTPCHLNCKPSKKYAREMLNILEQENPRLREYTEFFLKTASFFWGNMDYVLLNGDWENKRFRYWDSMSFFGSETYYMLPDKNRAERLKGYFSLVEKGDSLEIRPDSINVFSGRELIGTIEKKSEYECILAKPHGE